MMSRARILATTLLALVLLTTACGPESERTRGGGSGGDVGNRTLGPAIELHGRVDSQWNEPEIALKGAEESR